MAPHTVMTSTNKKWIKTEFQHSKSLCLHVNEIIADITVTNNSSGKISSVFTTTNAMNPNLGSQYQIRKWDMILISITL